MKYCITGASLAYAGLVFVSRFIWKLNRETLPASNGFNRKYVYHLKNLLIRHLVQNNVVPFTIGQTIQTLDCWHTHDYNWDYTNWCERCDNTNIYRQTMLYVFQFNVQGQRYIWHQPESTVPWMGRTEYMSLIDQDHAESKVTGTIAKVKNSSKDSHHQKTIVWAIWWYLFLRGANPDLPPFSWSVARNKRK